MRKLLMTGILMLVGMVVSAQDYVLPFNVKVGGQDAVAGTEKIFAKIAEAVAADAELEVDSKADMIIVNVFPCDAKGQVKTGAAAKIIMLQKTNKIKLDQTMDKTKLTPGNYVMNIVAGGKTARVMFKVK